LCNPCGKPESNPNNQSHPQIDQWVRRRQKSYRGGSETYLEALNILWVEKKEVDIEDLKKDERLPRLGFGQRGA
jgi:hypothetical protein